MKRAKLLLSLHLKKKVFGDVHTKTSPKLYAMTRGERECLLLLASGAFSLAPRTLGLASPFWNQWYGWIDWSDLGFFSFTSHFSAIWPIDFGKKRMQQILNKRHVRAYFG